MESLFRFVINLRGRQEPTLVEVLLTLPTNLPENFEDKHSSLFQRSVIYGKKSFVKLAPEIVSEIFWVLDPEYEQVSDQYDGIQKQNELGDQNRFPA
jgi:hypothetical protein